MSGYRLTPMAREQVDGIGEYSSDRWGERHAENYIGEFFVEFARIADGQAFSRPISVETDFAGFRRSWRSHVIYWRAADDGETEIVAVLHGKMDQQSRLREALSPGDQAHPSST